MHTVFIILSHNPQCCFGQLKYVFVDQQLPSVSAVLDWLDWLVKTLYYTCSLFCSLFDSLTHTLPTCTCSCPVCGGDESPPLPPPSAAPPLVLAACLLKRHFDSTLLNWRIILNTLPDEVC